MEKYYITTAIAYTSRKPHIGNTYEIVLTDAIARFKRFMGFDVYMLTGTDEHGQKIQQEAEKAGLSPKEYVDKISTEIRRIWDLCDTTYDGFIRTTDDYHEKAVSKIFQKLYDKGDIYKGEYEGLYCVPCESFFTETQLVDGKCPDCGREVQKTKETAYFFKMQKYADRLMKYIEENPDFIQPESRKKEMVNNFLKPGLQDLCVSRSSFSWGVPVPFDKDHIIYVWIDALSNYITALGYDTEKKGELFEKFWPADVHIIGKDILRFHTIYWPILLMALDLPLPKQIFGHPWLLSGTDKMSKSRGNVMYADDLIDIFGVDAVRYYLLHEMPFAQDGTIKYETVIGRYNSDLANNLGNLVSRTISMITKYFGGEVLTPDKDDEFACDLKNTVLAKKDEVVSCMDSLKVCDAVTAIFDIARRSNKYIDETMPWILAKNEEDKPKLQTVLYNLAESIRFIGVLLSSFMPSTSKEILSRLNTNETSFESLNTFGKLAVVTKVSDGAPMFVRLVEEDVMKKIEAMDPVKEEKKEEFLPEIEYDDFAKLDLRCAKVLECEKVEKADKLLKFTLQVGTETRTVVSGIAKYYKPEDLIGKTVVIVANLKPVKIRGIMSCGMILSAEGEKDLFVVTPNGDIESGSKVL